MKKSIKEDLKWSYGSAIIWWIFLLWTNGWNYFLPSLIVVLICALLSVILYRHLPDKFAFPISGLTWIFAILFAYLLPAPWNHCMGFTLSGFLFGSRVHIIRRERNKQNRRQFR